MENIQKIVLTIEIYKKNIERIRKRNQDYVNKIKLDIGGCKLCDKKVSNYIPECFDFDHINPDNKFMNVSALVHSKYSIKKIDTEIKKARLLCGNCHKLVTSDFL